MVTSGDSMALASSACKKEGLHCPSPFFNGVEEGGIKNFGADIGAEQYLADNTEPSSRADTELNNETSSLLNAEPINRANTEPTATPPRELFQIRGYLQKAGEVQGEGQVAALPRLAYEPSSARYMLSAEGYADEDEALDALAQGLGLSSQDAALLVVNQALKATLPPKSKSEVSANAVLGLIADAKPQGAIEALLVLSIVTAQLKGVEAFASAGRALGSDRSDTLQALGAKHFKVVASLTDSLSRLRRGGTQQVVVKHLTIADGSQAFIGNIEDTKKRVNN